MSKEGMLARQVMLGVVQTAEGLPLYHEVFDGNTGEVSTLKPAYHRLPNRIRAHAAICFIALILYRVMRNRFRSKNAGARNDKAALATAAASFHHAPLPFFPASPAPQALQAPDCIELTVAKVFNNCR